MADVKRNLKIKCLLQGKFLKFFSIDGKVGYRVDAQGSGLYQISAVYINNS